MWQRDLPLSFVTSASYISLLLISTIGSFTLPRCLILSANISNWELRTVHIRIMKYLPFSGDGVAAMVDVEVMAGNVVGGSTPRKTVGEFIRKKRGSKRKYLIASHRVLQRMPST